MDFNEVILIENKTSLSYSRYDKTCQGQYINVRVNKTNIPS